MQRLAACVSTLFAAAAFASAVPGQPAPAFSVTDLSGKPVKLEDYKGKTVVLEEISRLPASRPATAFTQR